MIRALAVIAAAGLVAAGAATAGPPADQTLYGNIASVKPDGHRYLLRIDPAFWLGGLTASKASAEDGFGSQVDNDYYIRDEGHKLLTYVLPKTARVTVLVSRTASGNQSPIGSARVPVTEFVQLLAGKNPKHRKLLGKPTDFGYWVTVHIDTVRALAAQYRP